MTPTNQNTGGSHSQSQTSILSTTPSSQASLSKDSNPSSIIVPTLNQSQTLENHNITSSSITLAPNINGASSVHVSNNTDPDSSGHGEVNEGASSRSLDEGNSTIISGEGSGADGLLDEGSPQNGLSNNSSDIDVTNSTVEESTQDSNLTNLTVSDNEEQGNEDVNEEQSSTEKVTTASSIPTKSVTTHENLQNTSEIQTTTKTQTIISGVSLDNTTQKTNQSQNRILEVENIDDGDGSGEGSSSSDMRLLLSTEEVDIHILVALPFLFSLLLKN